MKYLTFDGDEVESEIVVEPGDRVRLDCGDAGLEGHSIVGIVRTVRMATHLVSGNGTDNVFALRMDSAVVNIGDESFDPGYEWFTADESCIRVLDNV